MQRAQDLSPLELVEMFVTVFCFLKDSSEVSQTLLDDFKACQGYNFLADFLLRYWVSSAYFTEVLCIVAFLSQLNYDPCCGLCLLHSFYCHC